MKQQNKPFPRCGSRYGAPMGRNSARLDPDLPPSALAVSDPQGEYDSGGAYWGLSALDGPVFAVWRRGSIRDRICYVRARSRRAAKLAALEA